MTDLGHTVGDARKRAEPATPAPGHTWPDDDGHLWGRWMGKTRTTQYRVCVHPECSAHEEREAPHE